MNQEWLWVTIGFIGQALFSARFIIQWLASERARRSVIPIAFWFFSLGGGATLLAYAIYRRDPVFIAGQGAGLIIYVTGSFYPAFALSAIFSAAGLLVIATLDSTSHVLIPDWEDSLPPEARTNFVPGLAAGAD